MAASQPSEPACPTCHQPHALPPRECARCHLEKPASAFAGLDHYCRDCRREYMREYRRL